MGVNTREKNIFSPKIVLLCYNQGPMGTWYPLATQHFFHPLPDSVLKIVGYRVTCYVSYYPKCRVLPHILGIPNILDKPNSSGNTKYWVYPTSLGILGRDSILTTSKKEIISKIPQIPECEEGTWIYNQSNISTLLPYLNPLATQLFFNTQPKPARYWKMPKTDTLDALDDEKKHTITYSEYTLKILWTYSEHT